MVCLLLVPRIMAIRLIIIKPGTCQPLASTHLVRILKFAFVCNVGVCCVCLCVCVCVCTCLYVCSVGHNVLHNNITFLVTR